MFERSRHRCLHSLALAMAVSAIALLGASSASAATIWNPTDRPTFDTDPETRAVTLGVKFRSDVAGYITGIRYYKSTANTGTHTAALWSRTGTRLALATFTNESASGWQQVDFSSPVAIAANTTYIASYFAPNGHYANDAGFFQAAGVDNPPLHALRRGVDGPNGVYRYAASIGFPNTSSPATNYWVDVVFSTTTADTTPPSVLSTTPAADATDVSTSTAVSGRFNEDVQPLTIGFTLKDPAGQDVPASQSYDSLTRTARLTPSAPLQPATEYTATISGAKDSAGNTMSPVTWSFTTAAPPAPCPCSLWPNSAVPANPVVADNSAVELGVRFRSNDAGYITALRFYKGVGATGAHVGHLWTDNGTLLATAPFTSETPSGWQTVVLASPVPIQANTTYVASYYAPNGAYAANNDYFATAARDAAPLHAPQDGINGANGVYVYGASVFPTFTYRSSNYWVDVEFNQTATDTTAPTVVGRAPAPGSTTAPASTTVTATFSESVQASSISMTLDGPGGAVAGTTSYDAASRTATFTPNAPLDNLTSYTARVSGAQDAAGNTMSPDTWSFTTAAPPPPPPNEGPGGPILLVTSTANPFTSYYAEILRAEGLNAFDTVDAGSFSASSLANHDVVLLGETALNASQITALNDFVNAGGSLIAMRPDAQLAGLLGITRDTGSLSDAYLGVNTASEPAAGITAATMQYHGPADRYTLSGAATVATLFNSATAGTSNPAVTLRSVGSNGGQAAAFTYDLARSVVLTRQGNPAWAGQERDGSSPIRSDDQYFGASQPDFVDLTKVSIPQADEQQRLLANLIETMNRHRMPLPRFWYFPKSLKAVVIGTGDDHGNNGTAGRYDQYLANSPAGCSVADWTCPRFTSYIYPSTPLSNSAASGYDSQGFETGVHVTTNCANYTPASLEDNFATQLASFGQKYTSLPAPGTNRTHCIAWSDWVSHPITELAHSIRLDTNYYYWPGSWLNNRPGFMTGSGMPMRFAKTDGTMVDVYQAATQMTDESQQSYPFTPDALLDGALGPNGYYGAFTANMHTDAATIFENDQLMASARARNVPIVAARQMLKWLDGRNASSFKNLAWNGGTLSFSVAAGAGANGLTVMLPTASSAGLLNSLTLDGSPVTYRTETIKGLEYAFFTAAAGSYAATYATPAAAPNISSLAATTTDANEMSVQWSTDRAATTEIQWGDTATNLSNKITQAEATRNHAISLRDLKSGYTCYFRVTSRDPQGKVTTYPAAGQPPASYTFSPTNPGALTSSGIVVEPLPDGTTAVQWNTDQRAEARVQFGTAADQLLGERREWGRKLIHRVWLNRLDPGRRYYYRVVARNALGGITSSTVASFAASDYGVADSRLAQWQMGEAKGVTVTQNGDGELQLTDGSTTGTFVSRVLDARQMVAWRIARWYARIPTGTDLKVSVRTGSTSTPGASWTAWVDVPANGASLANLVRDSRFLQYRVQMMTTGSASPVLRGIGFTTSGKVPQDPTETEG